MSIDDITKRNLKTSTTNIIDNSKPGTSQFMRMRLHCLWVYKSMNNSSFSHRYQLVFLIARLVTKKNLFCVFFYIMRFRRI